MFTLFNAWQLPVLGAAIEPALQDGGGFWSQLNFATILILIGIIVVIFAIIGPSIRRIAVIEFIEPPKDGSAQKPRGIFGPREQISLGALGLVLLGFGITMEVNSSINKFLPTCPDAPSISILKVANVCGCDVSDFGEIQVTTNKVPIIGEWIDENRSLFNKDQLWALLIDESTDTVLSAEAVGMNPPRWNVTFSLGNEIGKTYSIRLWVLNRNAVRTLKEEIQSKKAITMPEAGDNPYFQEFSLERVAPNPENPTPNCKIPPREDPNE